MNLTLEQIETAKDSRREIVFNISPLPEVK